MATSTIPTFILALLQKMAGLTYPVTPVTIFDGFPGPSQPDNLIAVGGTAQPTAMGAQKWANLGPALKKDEEYDVGCFISCFTGGDANVSFAKATESNDAQLAARTNAFNILGVIENALRTDPRLLAVQTPPAGVLWCLVGRIGLQQTTVAEAGMGRLASVSFSVHVRARI